MKHRNKICLILLFAVSFCAFLNSCIRPPHRKPSTDKYTPAKYWVRVCLLQNIEKCKLEIPCDFEINDISGKTIVSEKTNTPVDVEIVSGGLKIGDITFETSALTITPQADGIFTINENSYRGSIEFIVSDDKKSFTAINHLPMEAYLYGVIAAEMPSYWEQHALAAQAIAARTYCLHTKRRFGKNRSWDLKATQAHQVYRGISAETSRTRLAVDETFGMVLWSKDCDGITRLFPAYYSSICGGSTENSVNVFGSSGGDFEALGGVKCPYCKQNTRPKMFYWPTVKFNKRQADKRLMKKYPILKKLGTIRKIVMAKEIDYGDFKRVATVKLVGSNGKSDILRGEDFRLTIDPTGSKIQSTICKMVVVDGNYVFTSGRGFGHGVGLCQYGARQLAKDGKRYRQILSYYYPKSKIETLY